MKSIILVTGASTGIGRLSAQALAEAGHVVYATMRDVAGRNRARADEVRALAAQKAIALYPLELDVLSQESADAAAHTIISEQGRLDVVMHNAGHLVVGPSEAFTPDEMTRIFDTNVFGAQRVNRAVLPFLRQRESGLLLWISSTTTKGTAHFPSAGKPADKATADAYARYDGVMDQIAERLSALTPEHTAPQAVADEVVRIVGLAKGRRPMRSVIDFVGDGAAEVLEVSERVRIEFAHRIGISDLLQATVRV